MAAPVKAYINPITMTAMPPINYISQKSIYKKNHNPILTFSNISTNNKSTIFPLNLKIPNPPVGFNIKTAENTVIVTFPAIYKERTGSRPTEGQLFPRGKT
jgi:hypothetical protein